MLAILKCVYKVNYDYSALEKLKDICYSFLFDHKCEIISIVEGGFKCFATVSVDGANNIV